MTHLLISARQQSSSETRMTRYEISSRFCVRSLEVSRTKKMINQRVCASAVYRRFVRRFSKGSMRRSRESQLTAALASYELFQIELQSSRTNQRSLHLLLLHHALSPCSPSWSVQPAFLCCHAFRFAQNLSLCLLWPRKRSTNPSVDVKASFSLPVLQSR